MANPIVTAITGYVEEHRTELISKAVLEGKTIDLLNLMVDCNGPTALNLFNTEVNLLDGSDCGFTDSGTSVELSQRILTPAVLKVNTTFCPKKLLKTWASYQVKLQAGRENLPFEEKFVDSIIDAVKAEIDHMLFYGQSGQTDQFEGLISILSGATGTIKADLASGTTATEAINSVYMKLPAEIISKPDTVILVPENLYRKYIAELVAANRYHYDPQYGEGVYKVEGSNVRVISTTGLNGPASAATYMIAGRLSNIFYGTDTEDLSFDLWWSKDSQVFKLAMNIVGGTQVAYPDQMVLGTVAASA